MIVDLIKQVPFLEALDRVAPGIEYDESRLPHYIACPLPDHYDKTPSCYLQDHRWWCFGCERGGDVLDFAQHYYQIDAFPEVIQRVRCALGLLASEDEEDADLAIKAAMARLEEPNAHTRRAWENVVAAVGEEFADRARAYLRHPERAVYEWADSVAGYVFEEIAALGRRFPRTHRRAREEVRVIRRWAREHARGLEGSVEALTGRDRLDVALQAPGAPDPPDPIQGLGGRLVAALEARAKQGT